MIGVLRKPACTGSPPAASRWPRQSRMKSSIVRAPTLLHLLLQVVQIRRQPAVAAGLQQVGAGGDRHDAAGHEVGEILAIDAGRKRDRELRPHRLAKFAGERERDHVQRCAGQVHDLFASAGRSRDGSPLRACWKTWRRIAGRATRPACDSRPQISSDSSNCRPRGVRLLVHSQIGVAHHVVEQVLQPLLAEHRRVHLHDHVHVELGEQELADPLDLVGRAAVERGERDAAAERGRIVEVAQRSEPARNLVAQPRRRFRGRRSCRG